MRVLVLGAAGQIGAWTVKDLVDYYDAEVVAADLKAWINRYYDYL